MDYKTDFDSDSDCDMDDYNYNYNNNTNNWSILIRDKINWQNDKRNNSLLDMTNKKLASLVNRKGGSVLFNRCLRGKWYFQ